MTIDDRLFPQPKTRREQYEQLKPVLDKMLSYEEEVLVLVSHGDTLGVLFALWLGLEAEMLNAVQFAGQAGGVSVLWQRGGKRIVRKFSDMSYLR